MASVKFEKSKKKSGKPAFSFNGKVLYGVPRKTASRKETDDSGKPVITNAAILALMEHGSPATHLPPRPLLRPCLEKHIDEIRDKFIHPTITAMMYGDTASAEMYMKKLALFIEVKLKAFFTDPDNKWVPLSPKTIAGRVKKLPKKTRKRFLATDKWTPYIDTGEFYKSLRAMFVK